MCHPGSAADRRIARGRGPARGGALDLNVRYGIEGYNINFTAYSLVTGCVLAIVVTNVSGLPRLIKLGIYAMLPVLAYAVLLSGTRGALVALGEPPSASSSAG